MNKAILLGSAGVVVALGMLAVGFVAGSPQSAKAADTAQPVQVASADTKVDRKEVEGIIRDYLLKNPEVLLEVQDALEAKQKEEQRLASLGVIKDAKDEIFNSTFDGVVGNPKGKMTIVEFYDYNCGFCKRAIDDMKALTKADPDLRFVLKEFPILGPASVTAARASLAAQKQDKYLDFHTKLMGFKGQLTDDVIYSVAGQVGLDLDKLKQDMNDPSVVAELRDNMDLAQSLGVQGTPAFVINDQIIPGAVGFDALKSQIDKDRAG